MQIIVVSSIQYIYLCVLLWSFNRGKLKSAPCVRNLNEGLPWCELRYFNLGSSVNPRERRLCLNPRIQPRLPIKCPQGWKKRVPKKQKKTNRGGGKFVSMVFVSLWGKWTRQRLNLQTLSVVTHFMTHSSVNTAGGIFVKLKKRHQCMQQSDATFVFFCLYVQFISEAATQSRLITLWYQSGYPSQCFADGWRLVQICPWCWVVCDLSSTSSVCSETRFWSAFRTDKECVQSQSVAAWSDTC